jgi:superfamily II RNA helicase
LSHEQNVGEELRRLADAPEAVEIIRKGPEKIDSQFAVSYSMVLNLLSTRTLPSCRSFFERSFARFQAVSGVQGMLDMADELERDAAELDAEAVRLCAAAKSAGKDTPDDAAALAELKVRLHLSGLRVQRL